MKTRHSMRLMLPLLGIASLSLGARPGRAITLEQKWQKGTQYTYDFAIQGDATIMTDAPNFPLANMPIPAKIKGSGQLALDTRDVDDSGVGTVVPTLAPFTLNADAIGQKFQAQLKSDKTLLLWNGRTTWTGPNPPPTALKIGRDGKLLGLELLPPATTAPADANTPPNANGGAAPTKAGADKNPFGPMLQNLIMRAFPALWPGHDVQEGDTWSVYVPRPTVGDAQPDATPDANNSLGKFDFKLGPEEKVGDRTARRVSVTGTVKYTGDPTATPDANGAPHGKLDSSSQKVSGNLWFDPTLGQVVRAELDVQSDLKGSGPPRPNAGDSTSGMFAFTGTVQLQLRNVVAPLIGNQ